MGAKSLLMQQQIDALRVDVDENTREMRSFKPYVNKNILYIREQLEVISTNMATKADLVHFATKADLEGFATKADLVDFATKADLADMATKADLEGFATKTDLQAMATRFDVEIKSIKTDLARMATKDDIQKLQETLNAVVALLPQLK